MQAGSHQLALAHLFDHLVGALLENPSDHEDTDIRLPYAVPDAPPLAEAHALTAQDSRRCAMRDAFDPKHMRLRQG